MARGLGVGSKVLEILEEINDTVGWIFYRGPRHLSMMGKGRDDFYALRKGYEARAKRAMIAEMKRQKIIDARKIGNRLEVKITEKGLQKLLVGMLRQAVEVRVGSDYCIVAWDIPESERARRTMLRHLFRECGFHCLQRSVWIAPISVLPILQEFVRREKLTPWIHIIQGKIVTEDKKRRFRLKRR